jgi:hypothetical protein
MDSRSSAAHRLRSRAKAAAKASARSSVAHAQATAAACRARCLRLYQVERETPSASHGCFAGRRGPMPCALRHALDLLLPRRAPFCRINGKLFARLCRVFER